MDIIMFIQGIFGGLTPLLIIATLLGGVLVGAGYLRERKIPNELFYDIIVIVFGFYMLLFIQRFLQGSPISVGIWVGTFLLFLLYILGCYLGRNFPR